MTVFQLHTAIFSSVFLIVVSASWLSLAVNGFDFVILRHLVLGLSFQIAEVRLLGSWV